MRGTGAKRQNGFSLIMRNKAASETASDKVTTTFAFSSFGQWYNTYSSIYKVFIALLYMMRREAY